MEKNNCTTSFRTVTGCSCRQQACIRNKQPDCTPTAVIPSITVSNADGITNLANCFVHVTSINTTFYIDDKHRVMITWAGPVEVDDYDVVRNPLGLRSQVCYTKSSDTLTEVFFDHQGIGHIIGREG